QAEDGICSPLLSETHPTWVNLNDDFRFLRDGRAIWGSERSGRHCLYLYDPAFREAKPLSPQGWAVAALDGVVEETNGEGYVLATGFAVPGDAGDGILSPIDRQVMRLPFDGGAVKTLAGDPGWNEVGAASPKTGSWVHTWSDADHLPRTDVRRG